MATATIHPSVPTPLDIHSNDIFNQNYQAPINSTFGMGSGGSFYSPSLNRVQPPTFPYPLPFQHPNVPYFEPSQVGPAPPFQSNQVTYNGGLPSTFQPYSAAVPHFQTQTSFTTVLRPTYSSSTSLQGALTPSLASLSKKVQKANPKSKGNGKRATRNATQSAKRELLTGKAKRRRGPNKRPPGTSFSDLLDRLPHKVRVALEMEYTGCCDSINAKDSSTKQKHWFTNRHCLNLPEEYQEAVPNFVCPAFLACKIKCKSKAGRYDSTERHCQNCAAFHEISSSQNEAYPVQITRSQYRDVRIVRTILAKKEGDGEAINEAVDSVRKIMLKDGLPPPVTNQEPKVESNGSASGAIVDHTAQPTCQPPTTSEPGVLESGGVDEWEYDSLQAIESNGSGPGTIMDHAAQPTSQPLTTSDPVFELEGVDEWSYDQSQVPAIKYDSTSNGSASGEIVNNWHAAQPTSQPLTISEPVYELKSIDELGCDLSQVINYDCDSESSGAGAIVNHTAQPTGTCQPPTTSGPVFEPECLKWNFDNEFF